MGRKPNALPWEVCPPAESTGTARQTRTARHEPTGAEAPILIDQVVSRENLIRTADFRTAWTRAHEPDGRVSTAREFFVNRRIRNRTYGGVGAWAGQPAPATRSRPKS